MENATKALLIAAAILIAILIISLGIVVYRMAAETVESVNLSEAEMTAFNSKFTAYEGEKVSAEKCTELFKVLIAHNQQEKNGTGNYVILKLNGDEKIKADTDKLNLFPSKKFDYNIKCKYGSNGLVNEIDVTTVNK